MQPLNDDMDELYRKAAENYPLNTGGADWDKVMQQLHTPDSPAAVTPAKKGDKRYLWLLLLLPIAFICTRYPGFNDGAGNNDKVNTPSKAAQSTTINETPDINKDAHTKTTNSPSITKAGSPGREPYTQSTTGHMEQGTVTANVSPVRTNDAQPMVRQANKTNAYAGKINRPDNRSEEANLPNKKITDNITIAAGNNKAGLRENGNKEDRNGSINSSNNDVADKEAAPNNIPAAVDTKTSVSSHQEADTTAVAAAKPVASGQQPDSNKTATASAKAASGKNKPKGFYAGITFGPDYSTIKFQHIKNTGYSVGVLIGYQLNSHIAFETGGLWDKKNYYSKGEYFNTSKIPISYNMTILNVTGSCNMVEIPINVRYNFNTAKQGHWFVSAGASSYLMKKEDYTYWVDHNNVQYDIYKDYKNSSRNWFSIMNISAGYERPILKNTLLRIEPYIKLPISGVGIGSLPITSTGLTISITRPALK